MAMSYVTYTADGKTDVFQVPFPFISQQDLKISLTGDVPPDGKPIQGEYLSHNNSIKLNFIPKAGSKVTVSRKTSIQDLAQKFQAGAINNEALSKNAQQSLLKLQELEESFEKALVPADGICSLRGSRITSLATPVDESDAATKGFVNTIFREKQDQFTKTADSIGAQVKAHQEVSKAVQASVQSVEGKVYDLLSKIEDKSKQIQAIEDRFTQTGIKAVSDAHMHAGQAKALLEQLQARASTYESGAKVASDNLEMKVKSASDSIESKVKGTFENIESHKQKALAAIEAQEKQLKDVAAQKQASLEELLAKTQALHEQSKTEAAEAKQAKEALSLESVKTLAALQQEAKATIDQAKAMTAKCEADLSTNLKAAQDSIIKTRLDSIAEIAELTGRHRELLRTCQDHTDQSKVAMEAKSKEIDAYKQLLSKMFEEFKADYQQKHKEMFEVLGAIKAREEAVTQTLRESQTLKQQLEAEVKLHRAELATAHNETIAKIKLELSEYAESIKSTLLNDVFTELENPSQPEGQAQQPSPSSIPTPAPATEPTQTPSPTPMPTTTLTPQEPAPSVAPTQEPLPSITPPSVTQTPQP
ncbi:MAG: hypothetical protein J0G29_02100 [Alphaproteobacteria bacterium]|nr:hypothetical protein [Alphaproteobacteria bacterium]OJV45219.1 MAG: hypothetical protein BGO28_00240 [Alphaproteobacteria bacterium 43-37]